MLRSAKYNNNNKMIENYLRELLMLCVPCRNEHPISENLGIFEEQYNSLNEMVEIWMEKSEYENMQMDLDIWVFIDTSELMLMNEVLNINYYVAVELWDEGDFGATLYMSRYTNYKHS